MSASRIYASAPDSACPSKGRGRAWRTIAALAMLGIAWSGSALGLDRRVATTGSDSGPCTSSSCATIGYALAQALPGDTIVVGFNQLGNSAFAEHVIVDKSVTIRGQGSDPSGANFSSIVSPGGGIPALFTIRAPNVTIRDLYFAVDFSDAAQGIRAESTGTFTSDGLVVDDVRVRAESSAPPAFAYGQRNAIWINPTSGPAFAATVTGTTVDDTTAPAARFRAGIDVRQAGLTASANDIISVNHDIYVAQQPPGLGVTIQQNFLRGFGVQFVAPLAGAGATLIDDNDFVPDADLANLVAPAPAGDFSALRLISNGVAHTVTVSNNTFDGHERAILIENFPGVTLHSNSFTPLTGSSSFQFIVVSNKELFSNASPPLPIAQSLAVVADGNTFNAGSVPDTGIAVMLLNDNAQGAPVGGYYGTIDFSNNNFVGSLGRYFELGGFVCASSNDAPCPLDALYSAVNAAMPGTPVVKFAGNVDAADGNEVDGTPISALTPSQRSAVLARTRDSSFDSDLGTVDYGFAPIPDAVFVDTDYAGESYGNALSFVHNGVNGGAAYPVHFGITAFATLQDAIAAVAEAGTIYVAAGTHDGATISRHVTVVGDDGSVNGDTVFDQMLTIAASGAGASDRLTLRNLTATNPAGDGIHITGSRSFLHLDGVSAVDNAGHGLVAFTNNGGLGDSTTTDLLIEDSHFDRNGDPGTDLRVGLIFDEEASVQGLRIVDSSFDENSGAGLSFNDLGAPASTTSIDDVHISGSSFSRNNPVDLGNGGGGLWLKTSGTGSSITDVLVETSTFADNGTGQLNGGLVNRRINANGISVRARPDTIVDGIVICDNDFIENAGIGGIQEAGVYVFDDTLATNQGYQPVEVCSSNSFSGLSYSVSGHEQRGARNTQPIVFVTGGSVVPAPEEINVGFVVNEDTGDQFRTINAAIGDADTIPGHSIFAPAGLYHENVLIGKPNLTVRGESSSRNLTIIDGRARSGSGVSFGPMLGGSSDGVTGATLRDLTVRGFQAIGTSGGACVYGPDGSDGTTVSNVLVHSCLGGRGGIFFAAGAAVDDLDIDGNEVHTSDGRGIVIWDGLKTNIRITDNLVRDMNGCCGIELQDGRASGVTVTGNVVRNVGDSAMSFIQLDGSVGPNLIAGNTIENFNGRFGIEIKIPNGTGSDDENAAGSIVVRDNVVRHSGAPIDSRDLAGIGVTRRSFINQYGQVDVVAGVVLRGNTVHGFRQPSSNEGHGIVVEGVQMRVSANVLYDNDVALQRQAGNEPASLPGDSNQAAGNHYFSRGNAPTVCAEIGVNQFGIPTPNGENSRDVLPPGLANAASSVTNVDTGRIFCSIQAAIDDAATADGHVLELADDGLFAEQVNITKGVRLTRSGGGDAPRIVAPATVVAPETLFRVLAPGVRIDSLEFDVDLDRLGSAIAALPGGGEPDGLQILDNTITAIDSNLANLAAAPFSRRHAISINGRGFAQFPGDGSASFSAMVVRGNTIQGSGVGSDLRLFGSGIEFDDVFGTTPVGGPTSAATPVLELDDNTLTAGSQDANLRFNNGRVLVRDNRFLGAGLEAGEAQGLFEVRGNTFSPASAAFLRALGIKSVQHGNGYVQVEGNTFDTASIGVAVQNSQSWHLVDNVFNAPAAGDFAHLWISTKAFGGLPGAYARIEADVRGNEFNGPGDSRGTAVYLADHHYVAGRPAAGSVSFGAPGETNAFGGEFAFYFRLSPATCSATNPATCSVPDLPLPAPALPVVVTQYASSQSAPFPVDVDAVNNTFDGVLPSAMGFAGYQAVQARTYHDDPNAPESPSVPPTLGLVDYGFAAGIVATTTTVSTSANPSAIGASVTVTVSVANALGGVPSGNVVVSAPGSAGCTITSYAAGNTSCTIAGGFATGGAKLVSANFAPTPGSVNIASSGSSTHYVTFAPGTVTVTPATTPSALDNDYTRINDAVQSSGSSVTIQLDGDFDWNEPFAEASWAANNYEIPAPTGRSGVVIRGLRDAVGTPDDISDDTYGASVSADTAGLTVNRPVRFIRALNGSYQGWAILDLRLVGFERPISMVSWQDGDAPYPGSPIDAMSGLTISGNRIEMSSDRTVATSSNMAISFGPGENIHLNGNHLVIDGDRDHATGRSTYGFMNYTTGDSSYGGLQIDDNLVEVGAPSGLGIVPERVVAIWENTDNRNGPMQIVGNRLIQSPAFADPTYRNRRVAIMPNHASDNLTVEANTAEGWGIGFSYMAADIVGFAMSPGNGEGAVLVGNTFAGNQVAIRNVGTNVGLSASFNRIVGGVGFLHEATGSPAPAIGDNWWGCNGGPAGGAGCATQIGLPGGTPANWLRLRLTASPTSIPSDGTTASALATQLVRNTDASIPAGLSAFPEADYGFASGSGAVSPALDTQSGGSAASSLTSTIPGGASITTTLDNGSASTFVLVTNAGGPPNTVDVGSCTSQTAPPCVPSPLDNDYTRINNAIQAALPGTTIVLSGDFNWLEANAFASWQAGSNGLVGDGDIFNSGGDDWSVRLPAGLNGVTVRAGVGGASVQGSEGRADNGYDDLAAFIVANATNQGWRFEGLTLRGFDLAIGMFVPDYVSGERFSGTQFIDNQIEIGPDSGDDFGNYGLYAGYGADQTIAGNSISMDVQGADGAPATNSRSIGIQIGDSCNVACFDGLVVSGNDIAVSGIPAATPPRVYGVWENAGDADSSITIEDNAFAGSSDLGTGVENNGQTAFIVTTQSNGARLSAFRRNDVTGAAIGLRSQLPIYGHYVVSDSPLRIEGNTFVDNGTALRLHGAYPQPGKYVLRHNRIAGNVIGLYAERADDLPGAGDPGYGGDEQPTQIDANDNWWGCNEGPIGPDCDAIEIEAGADPAVVQQSSWLRLRGTASPNTIVPPSSSAITVDLVSSSDGTTVATGFPDGTGIGLTTSKGTLNPAAPFATTGGAITTSLQGHVSGYAFLDATLDEEAIEFAVIVAGPVTVNDDLAPGHADPLATCAAPDFTTIQAALDTVPPGATILVCTGTYDEDLLIADPVTIRGAQYQTAGAIQTGDASVVIAANDIGLSPSNIDGVIATITADDVLIEGMSFDGNNPAISSPLAADVGGIDVDYGYGIFVDTAGDVSIRNSVVRNVAETAYYGAGNGGDNLFASNLVVNAGGRGVILANSYYASVLDSRFDNVRTGVQTNNIWQANPGVPAVIAGNVFSVTNVGIFHNLTYAAGSPFEIRDNDFVALHPSSETSTWRGIWVESLGGNQTVVIEDNEIDASAIPAGVRKRVGYLLNNVTSTAPASTRVIDGGTVTGVDVGVLSTDATFYTGPVNDFVVRDVAFSDIALAVFYVEDTIQEAGTARLTIGNNSYDGSQPHHLALSGAAPQVAYDGPAGLPTVLVRGADDPSADPNYWGLLAQNGNAYTVRSGVVNQGIQAVAVGGVVTLEDGTFDAAVSMNKASVTLRGARAGLHGTDAAREADTGDAFESVVTRTTSGTVLTLAQGGLTIDGITLLGSPAGHAVDNAGGALSDDLEFINNRVRNVSNGSGITSEPGTDCNSDGFSISRNLFRGISGGGAANGRGVRLGNGHCNVEILDNDFQSVTYAVNANGGAGTVQDLRVEGNRVATTSATALVITGTTRTEVTRNSIVGAAGGLFISDRMTDFVATCNGISASNNGISTSAFFGNAANSGVRIFHNAISGGSADVNNGLAQGLLVGSNWYGGTAAGTTNSGGPLLVADALIADPTGDANCGDNDPVALVLYPATGTPQSTDLNQAFAQPLRSRVQDVLGGAVVGETVSVLAPASGASALLSPAPANGTLPALVTDYNGVAQVSAIANGFAGTYAVTATHASNAVAFMLTNVALEQVLFDLNGPVGGVEVGDTVPYTGLIANENPDVDENVRIRVQIGADSALDPDDVQLCVVNPSDTSQCLPVAMSDDGTTLSFDFPDVFGDLDGFDVTSPLPYEFLHNFRVVFGKAGVFTTNAQVVGVESSTVYAVDTLSTEVVARHAGVALDLTGPVAGVEKDEATAYTARLSNTAAAVADDVVVEFVLTRTGGIADGDVTVEYFDDMVTNAYVEIPLDDSTPGQLRAYFGPLGGFALPQGYDETSLFRVTYHVAPDTFSVAATVIDAAGDTDGVPAYAADNLSTEVIEADPDLSLSLSGLFDIADGETLVAGQVAQAAILRAELVNAGGDVADLVQAAVTIAPDFSGIADTDVVASYWFVPSLGGSCAPVPPVGDRETVSFAVDGDTLTATTDPQSVTEDFELAVCFSIEFLRPGVYNIGAVIEDALADTDGRSDYTADNLAVTIADSNATISLAGLGTFVFDGAPHAATANTTPSGLIVETTYALDNGAPSASAPVEAGNYLVSARVADGQGYSGIATGTLTIAPKPLTIALSGDAGGTFVYDGSSRVATASVTGLVAGFPLPVSPAPGSLQVRYDGVATPPTDAGAYTVTALFDPPSAVRNYVALPAISSINIVKRSVAVNIDAGDLVQVFDGTPRSVDASYVLPSLPASQSVAAFEVRYDGSLSAPTAVGVYTVVATVIDANYEGSASATLSIVPAALDRVELAALAATTATVDTAFNGSAAADFCALVSDVNDDPVADVGVTFATPADGASALLASSVVLTDASGIACVAANANTMAGAYALTATVPGIPSDMLGLENLADTDEAQVRLAIVAGNGQTAPVGEVFSVALQVEARDRFGNVLDGIEFEPVFAAPLTDPTATLSSATQNLDGSWQVTATAGDFAGSYAVTATIDDALVCDSGQCTVSFGLANTTATPVDVALVSDVATNVVATPGGDYSLTATVTDAANGGGQGVSGVSVTFVLEPGANGAGTTLSNVVDLTDANGVATAVLPANTRAGAFAVRAVVSGVGIEGTTPDSVALTNLAAAADALEIVSGDDQSVAVETAFLDLVVRVVDAFDNPVAGTSVGFVASPAVSGASADVPATPDVSDADGLASVIAVANDIAGSYTVQASAAGLDPVAFDLTNTLGAIAITNLRWNGNDLTSIAYSAADQAVEFDTTPTVDAADCTLLYNGSTSLPRHAGSWFVQVSCSTEGFSGTAGATLTITKADSGIALAGGSVVYDGSPKPASVTNPNGAAYVLAYAGTGATVYGPSNVPPTVVGTYEATLTVDDPNYEEATALTAALEITPANVTLSFGNLSQVYDGNPKSVSVATTPSGVAGLSLGYAPNDPPVNAGSYTATATLANPNYVLSGSTSATLTITQATAQIFLSNLTQIFDGSPKSVVVNTVPASLAGNVVVTYDGSATSPSAVGNYAVVASLSGQQNYADASVNATMSIVAAAISQFVIDSATPIAGTAGADLPSGSLPTVRVLDTNGNGVAGVSIVFELGTDSGSATGLAATTDANGRATVGGWTLDRDAGADSMTARVNGLAGLPTLTFNATGAELAGIALSKSSTTTEAQAFDAITYSIVASHAAGPSNAASVDILDALPDGLDVGTATWLCAGTTNAQSETATCDTTDGNGDVDVTAYLPVGTQITITLTATVEEDAVPGPLVNEASAVLTSSTDPDTSNNDDDHTITIVPRPSGACSVFCDGFEGEALRLVAKAAASEFGRADMARVLVPAQLAVDRPVKLFEAVDADGLAVAVVDGLQVGAKQWFRLRHRDADGAERFSAWTPIVDPALGVDWALDVDGVVVGVGAKAELRASISPGRPLPHALRSDHAIRLP